MLFCPTVKLSISRNKIRKYHQHLPIIHWLLLKLALYMKLNLSMIWKLSLTPQNMELKKVSLLSPELMLSCCECLYSVCILCALIFKHLLKYANYFSFILVSFICLLVNNLFNDLFFPYVCSFVFILLYGVHLAQIET